MQQLGEPLPDIMCMEIPQPIEESDRLILHGLYADHFGNLVTDLTRDHYDRWLCSARQPARAGFMLRMGETQIDRLNMTFSDAPIGQWVAYFGSSGRLEIAIRQGRAVDSLMTSPGQVTLELTRDMDRD